MIYDFDVIFDILKETFNLKQKEKALCDAYIGKYLVISISLKGVNVLSYATAFQLAVQVINEAAAKV